jgi:hypothetical protein
MKTNEVHREELRAALASLVEILARHGWPIGHWTAAIADLESMATAPLEREELARWSTAVANGFGVGMGSIQDVYLEEGFEELVERTLELLGRMHFTAREAPGYIPRLRRHLTELEEELLKLSPLDAPELRAMLTGPDLDLERAHRFLVEVEARAELPAQLRAVVDQARAELDAIRTRSSRS